MAQTTIASLRNFQSQRYVLPQLDIRNDKKRRKAVNQSTVVAATAVNQSNAVNSRFFNISEIISKTYSIFPKSFQKHIQSFQPRFLLILVLVTHFLLWL